MAKPASTVDEAVIRERWDALVKKLGGAKGTRFLISFEHGERDSIGEIKRVWRGKSIEIYRAIAKQKSNSGTPS